VEHDPGQLDTLSIEFWKYRILPGMVSTSGRRTRPTRAETRQRVLDAAAAAFETRGFDKASIDDIAAGAGLTKGAVYSSFRTKEELFVAVMNRQIDERIRDVTDAIATVTAGADAVHAIAAAVTAATYRDPGWHVAFLEFWTKAMRTPALRQSLAVQRRRAREIIAEKIQQHADALGIDLPLSPAGIAITILALSNGLAVEQLLDTTHADPALLDDILSALMIPEARSAARYCESGLP
jgi:AcrR family transcriptional regulator